jgi:hypothetical protein
MSGSMSGMWKRGMVRIMRHRQTKEPETDRPYLNNRVTSRLYAFGVATQYRIRSAAHAMAGRPANAIAISSAGYS